MVKSTFFFTGQPVFANSASTSTGTKSSRSARNLAEHAGGCQRKKERVDLWRQQFHAEARELGRWWRSSFTRTARRTGRGSFRMLKSRHPEGDARGRKSSSWRTIMGTLTRKYVYKAFCQTLPTPVAECGWILFFLDSPKFQDFKMAHDSTALSNWLEILRLSASTNGTNGLIPGKEFYQFAIDAVAFRFVQKNLFFILFGRFSANVDA